jgi:hypothetical protein
MGTVEEHMNTAALDRTSSITCVTCIIHHIQSTVNVDLASVPRSILQHIALHKMPSSSWSSSQRRLLDPEDDTSKCQKLLIQWHSATSQETYIFSNTTVRTSNPAHLYLLKSILNNLVYAQNNSLEEKLWCERIPHWKHKFNVILWLLLPNKVPSK